jgi:hypothetical protein
VTGKITWEAGGDDVRLEVRAWGRLCHVLIPVRRLSRFVLHVVHGPAHPGSGGLGDARSSPARSMSCLARSTGTTRLFRCAK